MKFIRRVIWYLQRNSFYTFDRALTILRMLIGAPELYYRLYVIEKYRDIKLFNFSSWHHSCRYLVASRDGVRVFIKLGHNFLIHNEVEASRLLRKSGSDLVLEVIDHRISRLFSSYVTFPFLEGYAPLDEIGSMSADQRSIVEHQLKLFLAQIKSVGIVHRDIKPANIFVEKSGVSVKVIDFAMSLGENLETVQYALFNDFIQWDMGGDYKMPNGEWCDDYAMELIFKQLSARF